MLSHRTPRLAPARRATLAAATLAVAGACASATPHQGTFVTLDQMRARAAADSAVEPARPVSAIATRRAAPDEVELENPAPRVVARRAEAPRQEPAPRGRWITPPPGREPPVVDLSVYERPLADVLSLISARAGVAIVPSDERAVRDKVVTAEIPGYPWHIALEALLSAHGLRAVQEPSGIIKVVTEGRAEVERTPMPVRLKYLYARDFLPSLQRVVAAGDSSENSVEVFGDAENSRDLIVYASPDRLDKVRALVDSMDRRPATITVEARLVSVNRSRLHKLGFSYAFVPASNDSTGRLTTGVDVRQSSSSSARGGLSSEGGAAFRVLRRLAGLGTLRLDVFVDALDDNGIAETETTPIITATSGRTSEILVGDQIILPNPGYGVFAGGAGGAVPFQGGGQQGGGYPGGQQGGGGLGGSIGTAAGSQLGGGGGGGFSQFETGTRLKVTPHYLGDDMVRVNIELVRDGGQLDPDGRSITGGKQTATTEVTVRNDEPIVIGGLTVNGKSETTSGFPFLSSLPVVGRAFRNESVSENHNDLVIIITPHVHPDGAVTITQTAR
jgi:Flp pilus assembly secretin CpaC